MKKFNFILIVFLLFLNVEFIYAELVDEEEIKLKEYLSNRYDDFESPKYKKKWKSEIELKNREISEIKVIKHSPEDDYDNEEIDKVKVIKNKSKKKSKSYGNKPWKYGKYSGIYKVGTPYEVLGKKYYPREQPNYVETGMASWYGEEFHNEKTANGETYNMNDYTAAHTTLPLPSVVRVTNLENGKSINVRVNDRGPFIKGRIIDVSKKVAKKLDFHSQGLTKVKVEFLKDYTNEMLEDYGLK